MEIGWVAPQLQWLRSDVSEQRNGWAQKGNNADRRTGRMVSVRLSSSRPLFAVHVRNSVSVL